MTCVSPHIFTAILLSILCAAVAQSVLSLLPPTAVTATNATVQWAGIPAPVSTDWVAWYCTGAATTAYGAWQYVNALCPGTFALGACSNISWAVTYAALGCSQIELRYYRNPSPYTLITTSGPLTWLTPSPSQTPSMTPSPTPSPSLPVFVSVAPLLTSSTTAVSVTWARIPAPASTDWVAWYCSGTPVLAYGPWVYVTACAGYGSGACAALPWNISYAALNCSQVEVRYYRNPSPYTLIATSTALVWFASYSQTLSASQTASQGATPSQSPTLTGTPSWSATGSQSPTTSASATQLATSSTSATPSGRATPSQSASCTPSLSTTGSETATASISESSTPTMTRSMSGAVTPSATLSISQQPTASASASAVQTASATSTGTSSQATNGSRSASQSQSISQQPTASASASAVQTASATSTGTSSRATNDSRSASQSQSTSQQPTASASASAVQTASATSTGTSSQATNGSRSASQSQSTSQQQSAMTLAEVSASISPSQAPSPTILITTQRASETHSLSQSTVLSVSCSQSATLTRLAATPSQLASTCASPAPFSVLLSDVAPASVLEPSQGVLLRLGFSCRLGISLACVMIASINSSSASGRGSGPSEYTYVDSTNAVNTATGSCSNSVGRVLRRRELPGGVSTSSSSIVAKAVAIVFSIGVVDVTAGAQATLLAAGGTDAFPDFMVAAAAAARSGSTAPTPSPAGIGASTEPLAVPVSAAVVAGAAAGGIVLLLALVLLLVWLVRRRRKSEPRSRPGPLTSDCIGGDTTARSGLMDNPLGISRRPDTAVSADDLGRFQAHGANAVKPRVKREFASTRPAEAYGACDAADSQHANCPNIRRQQQPPHQTLLRVGVDGVITPQSNPLACTR